MRLSLFLILAAGAAAQTWTSQTSGSNASLRGVSAVSSQVAFASGSGGTWLVTKDGGATWQANKVPGAEQLDFRAVHAVDEQTVYLLSIGAGDKSRIYKTTDGGAHWNLLLSNPDAKGFLDELAFWDPQHGIVLGDPVDGEFVILTTADGGKNWTRQHAPAALAAEGAFAASNSSLAVLGSAEVWFGTGGPGGARVFHSQDGGKSWKVSTTPIRNDAAAAGIFSLAFSDSLHGIAVGGDYSKPAEDRNNIALTSDGGTTWSEPAGRPKGFRSAVAWLPNRKVWLATGTSGSDTSSDGGKSWTNFDSGNYNAFSLAWAVGPRGRIAHLTY
ncbi:MAG TPA: hypothetical protein VG456_25685 [Candidatus Sulfopaludibacter sp.]|jgi:photosystem II stability/assembly factor-like uncharacterized protein|nr:hypothetical protein [Candidatus Sulfopaludibacter sp.]